MIALDFLINRAKTPKRIEIYFFYDIIHFNRFFENQRRGILALIKREELKKYFYEKLFYNCFIKI
jgi:hypothetical protein